MILILFLLISITAFCQTPQTFQGTKIAAPECYATLPVRLPVSMAGGFGEIRPNHFHSGLDQRTGGKEGERVFYLGKTKEAFMYVRTSKGKVGYMYKGFLDSYGAANKSQVYYAKKSVKVFKKASTSSGKVTKLSKNQHVIVYNTKGSWAYIKTLSGKGGYVKTSALKKAK